MQIGVLGTGNVAQTIARHLAAAGNRITFGSRDPASKGSLGYYTDAKATVTSLLNDLGWGEESVVELGGVRSARGPEHYFVTFAALMQSLRTPAFNIRLVT